MEVTQNWYHDNGHITRNNAITSTNQMRRLIETNRDKFAIINRADATPVRVREHKSMPIVSDN